MEECCKPPAVPVIVIVLDVDGFGEDAVEPAPAPPPQATMPAQIASATSSRRLIRRAFCFRLSMKKTPNSGKPANQKAKIGGLDR